MSEEHLKYQSELRVLKQVKLYIMSFEEYISTEQI